MKNNSLVPGLKKKFECLKVEEISGWRKGPYSVNPDLHPSTKLPALLKDRSDYHKHLIYPHWTLNPINSDTLKHSNSKRKIEVFPLIGKEEILDYEKRSEYERIQGKNILIGSLTTRNPSVSLAPFTFLVNRAEKKLGVKKIKSGFNFQGNKKVYNNIQISLAENETKESSECQNHEQNLNEKNEILTDMLNNSISRAGSAIVFGNKKTLFDLYSSALRSGSVKTKKDAEKLIKDTLDKGVLVKDSQKSKLFLRKDEEHRNSESVDSSFSSISPKCEQVFRKSNGRKDSLACKSEMEHSSVYSKNSKGESMSTNATGSVRVSQRSLRKQENYTGSKDKAIKSEIKLKKVEKNSKNDQKLARIEIDKKTNKSIKNLKESRVKVRELAMIEIIDPDEDLIDKRSKSVINFYENRSIAGSSGNGNRNKLKPPSPPKSGIIVFQNIQNPIKIKIPTEFEEESEKTPEKQKSQSKLKKNQGKNSQKNLTKQVKKQIDSKLEKISTQSQNLPTKIPSSLDEPLPKEKIAERILEEYKKVPKNLRRSSVSLDVIHENPKNVGKKSLNSKDLPNLKLNRRSSIEVSKKKEEISPKVNRRSLEQKPEESDFLLKKRYSVASPRISFTSRDNFPKDQKSLLKDPKDYKQQSKDVKDLKQLTKENSDVKEDNPKILVKKPTFGEKSYRSSASYRTEDFNDKSWSRSSSFKKNLVFANPPKPKKIKKVKKKNSDSSQEISDYEENVENSYVSEITRSDRKKKSIIYEINLLDRNKENNEKLGENENEKNKEKSVLVKGSSLTESETEEDSSYDLSELMQNKNFSMNKFAFSPQVCFRFSQRVDKNTYLNVNDIEINEYNLDHENFENFINKKRFANGVNSVIGLYRSNNKHLEILDVDKFLPVQIHRKKLREFEKMRKKDLILQSRGKIVEISKKKKFSFSGLECERLDKLPKIEREKKEITDQDIIKSGGSLTVKNQEHLEERLYCRVKDVYNLETISGMNSNSVGRIINSLKASLKTLEKASHQTIN